MRPSIHLIGLALMGFLALLLGFLSYLDGDWVPLAIAAPGFVALAWVGIARIRS